MAKFAVQIKASAKKELDQVDDAVFGRLDRKLAALADNPRPSGCKKLVGYRDLWRIRVGGWRVINRINDKASVVTITRVAHRSEAYGS